MFTNPSFTLGDQIYWTIDLFLKIMAREACKRRIGLYAMALRSRVQRFERRFLALYALWKAGKLPGARVRGDGTAADPSSRPSRSRGEGGAVVFDPMAPGGPSWEMARQRPASVLPRAFAWMHRMLPESAGTLGGYVGSLLDPNYAEMKAFVVAVPQAGRLLRPICAMAGVKAPDWLALPKRRRPPPRPSPARAGEGDGRLRRPRRRDFANARDEALAWMRWSAATKRPVDPRKMSAVALGYILHWPRDGNCPPPEIGYGGRMFPPLPKGCRRRGDS